MSQNSAEVSRLTNILLSIQEARDDFESLKDDISERYPEKLDSADGSRFVTLFYCFDELITSTKYFIDKLNADDEPFKVESDPVDIYVKAEVETDNEFDHNDPISNSNDYNDYNSVKKEESDVEEALIEENTDISTVKSELDSNPSTLYPEENPKLHKAPKVKRVKDINGKPIKEKRRHRPGKNLKGPGPFKCLACGKEIDNKYKFVQHLEEDHKGEKFKCNCCDREFKFYKNLKVHISKRANKDGEDQVECDICKKKFHVSYIKSHIKRHEGIETVNCDVCGKTMQKNSLREHMWKHTKEANFQCGSCPKKFITEEKLSDHYRFVHEKFRPCKCEICGKGFKTPSLLKVHQVVHTGERMHTCDLCGMTFNQKAHLRTHIRGVHEGKKQKKMKRQDAMCNTCGKVFFSRQYLRKHEEMHAPVRKTYPCEICNKVLKAEHIYKRHIKVVHEGSKPFSCEVCQKTFANSNAVKEHMTMHTGEKPHKCEQCDKCFTQKSSLCAHKRRCHKQGAAAGGAGGPEPKPEPVSWFPEPGNVLSAFPSMIPKDTGLDE